MLQMRTFCGLFTLCLATFAAILLSSSNASLLPVCCSRGSCATRAMVLRSLPPHAGTRLEAATELRVASCIPKDCTRWLLPVTMVRGCCNARNVYRHFLSMCNAGAAHAATTRGRTLLKVQPPLLTGWSLGYKQGCIVYRVVLKPTMYFTATGSLCQARISACRVSMHGSKLLQSNWKPSHGQHSVAIAIVPSVLTHSPVCDDPTSEPLTTAAVRR
jgi:hypothetical protein